MEVDDGWQNRYWWRPSSALNSAISLKIKMNINDRPALIYDCSRHDRSCPRLWLIHATESPALYSIASFNNSVSNLKFHLSRKVSVNWFVINNKYFSVFQTDRFVLYQTSFTYNGHDILSLIFLVQVLIS